ncbi:MAG: TIGR01212 family radical SAM protein [Clostridia bacterium]|nr:TIGR01212 family radical SAM protein [Clostridia bacterium]
MFNSFNSAMKKRFGCKIYKLSLSGGMTCPTRDGTLGTRGCIFCSADGSGDFAAKPCEDIAKQINNAKALVAAKAKDAKYIAYFQDYTNTYAPTTRLRRLFTQAIKPDDVVALSIGTRPDCLPDDVVELLAELNRQKPVFVELGLQTIHESTAEYIRRGYKLEVFDDAVRRLRAVGIEVIVHIIIGLPGETEEMIYDTVRYLADMRIDGIKLQLLHVLDGTDLADEYRQGKFDVLDMDKYIDILENCVRLLPPETVIHRLTGDGAKKDLIAPLWSADKKNVLNTINRRFREDGVKQASRYKAD